MTLPIARDLAAPDPVVSIAPGLFDAPLWPACPEAQDRWASVPFPARLGRRPSTRRWWRHIISNPMLNGEVIRLDGAIRMAPR